MFIFNLLINIAQFIMFFKPCGSGFKPFNSLSSLHDKKKRFTWNVNKSVTRVFSCSGPQNLSTRLMRVMLLHSMYWLSSPTPSFTSRRYSILNTVTESFPKIFKFPYLNVVLLISTLSLFGSYLKQKERQLYNCEDLILIKSILQWTLL